MSSVKGMHAPTRGMGRGVQLTDEEIRLVRQAGESLVDSFEYRGAPASEQPKGWHDGHVLLALVPKLESIRRSIRRRSYR